MNDVVIAKHNQKLLPSTGNVDKNQNNEKQTKKKMFSQLLFSVGNIKLCTERKLNWMQCQINTVRYCQCITNSEKRYDNVSVL